MVSADEKEEHVERISKKGVRAAGYQVSWKALFLSGLVVTLCIGAVYTVTNGSVLEANGDNNQQVKADSQKGAAFDKQVYIAWSVKPYETNVRDDGTVRITNNYSKPVDISFETMNKDGKIQPDGHMDIDLSKQRNLPQYNYFHVQRGDREITGKIILK